jgi:type I restriction enzyme S subunit
MSNQASLGEISNSKASEESTKSENTEKYDAIRIERDEFGELPKDWCYAPLGELKEYVESGCSESQNKEGKGLPVSRIETIADGVVNYDKVGYVPEDKIDEKKYLLEPGDLLFSNINSREEIGKTAIYEGKKPLYHGMNVLRIGLSEDINDYFGYYLFDSEMGYRIFFRNSQAAVGQSSINQGQLKGINLPVPTKPEQRRIASVLYNLDQAIQKTEEIIEQTQRVKKGLIQDIFDRFSGDMVKLEDVAEKKSENVKPVDSDRDRHVGLEHISPEEMYPDFENISNVKSTKRPFTENEVLFAKLRPNLEKAAYANFSGLCSSDIFVLIPQDSILPKFLYHRLNTKEAFDHARRTSAGTRMPRTSWSLLSNWQFELPEKEDQQRIVEIIEEYDKEVSKLKKEKEQLQRLKKGLMQDLLTGKVRTSESVEVLDEVTEVES